MNRWRQRRRSKRFCHHELPCYCGLPLDPKFKNDIDPWVYNHKSDLTETDKKQIRSVLS